MEQNGSPDRQWKHDFAGDAMRTKIAQWMGSIYIHDGRFTGALLEDLILLASIAVGFHNLLSRDRNPADGFFDSTLTFTTLSITATVMIAYHLLWRILETTRGGQGRLEQEPLAEQVPRFCAALSLLIGLYNFSKNVPLFLLSLVLFYSFLMFWHFLVSPEMRKIRGTIVFDFFGLVCALAFAWLAFDLYTKSQIFWKSLPYYATDPLSADVVKRSFAGRQINFVYLMGLCAGAMAANAILAFFRGLEKGA